MKTNTFTRKLITTALATLLAAFIALTVTGAAAESGPWVPDPCNVLGVEGEYYLTNTEPDGNTFDVYLYTIRGTTDDIARMAVAYGWVLQEDLGYTVKKVRYENSPMSFDYSKNGYLATISFFIKDGGDSILNGGTGTWLVGLCVQHGMSFTPGEGTPGIIDGHVKCACCHGTGYCEGCGGTGRANYGDGYKDCILCDGSGICNSCGGNGY